MTQTLKDQYTTALIKRGERLVKRNFKHDVYSRKAGGFYYVGRSGGLRAGQTSAGSVPCNDAFKRLLIESLKNVELKDLDI